MEWKADEQAPSRKGRAILSNELIWIVNKAK